MPVLPDPAALLGAAALGRACSSGVVDFDDMDYVSPSENVILGIHGTLPVTQVAKLAP